MARIRSIKPEFWGDRKLAKRVSRDARLLYIALWNQADEWGRVNGDPQWIKGHCFPYDDDLDIAAIDELVNVLAWAGRVRRYDVEGDPYLFLPKLSEHQKLEPAKVASRLPEPPAADPSEPRADSSEPDPDESEKKSALHVACSREQVAGSRGVARRPDGAAPPQDDPTGALLAEHVSAYAEPPPIDAQAAVKTAIMRQVARGERPERIRDGLARMREKRLGAGMLPELMAECSQVTRPSTTNERVTGTLALAEKYDAQEQR